MRNEFVKALCEEAKKNKKIMLLTGDLGFNVLEPFANQFPGQFINVGVAEANLITISAGLASAGFIPFAYSIATFATMRPFEQIRNDISLQNLNVKIVGIGGGLAYGKAGPTHHSMEDIALMRLLPNMTIVSPSDPLEAYQATKALIKKKGPAYLRLEKDPDIKNYINHKFQIGKAQKIKQGKSAAIIATGAQVYNAVKVAKELEEGNINLGVYSFSTIQPLDIKLLSSIINDYSTIITLEEHRTSGGFGTAVEEFSYSRNFKKRTKIIKLGLKNIFSPFSASYNNLIDFHGISDKKIKRMIIKSIKNV